MESRIQVAIQAFENGEYPSMRACAIAFEVPYQKLQARLHGRSTTRGGHNKALSDEQEKALTTYLDRCIYLGRPSKKKYLRAAADTILRLNGQKKVVSKMWTLQFLRRNPQYKKIKTKPLAYERQAA
jgi:hypothetical protein